MTADKWDFQPRAVQRVHREYAEGKRRVILMSPTGSGKTAMACEMMKRARAAGRRCLFMAPARELVKQCSNHLEEFGIEYGRGHSILMAGEENIPESDVLVVSPDTLWARRHWIDWPKADFIVWDECHQTLARTRRAILDRYQGAWHLGLSATPGRADKKTLGDVWESLVLAATYGELIDRGVIVPVRAIAARPPDLSGVRKGAGGDFVQDDALAERVQTTEIIGDILTHYQRWVRGRQAILFAVTVAHSIRMRDQFREWGIRAEHVDGKTPADERDDILRRLREGDLEVVCNYNVLGQGVDLPSVSAVINARPCNSLVWWRQSMNRPGRAYPGKENVLLVDHTGSLFRLGFPDEDIEWPLHGDVRAAQVDAWIKRPKTDRVQRSCPKCATYWEGAGPCPTCGWKPTRKSSDIPRVEGSLEEVARHKVRKAKRRQETPQKSYLRLLAQCAHTGGTIGQAQARFKNQWGQWPQQMGVGPASDYDERRMKVATKWPGFVRRKS